MRYEDAEDEDEDEEAVEAIRSCLTEDDDDA
jgi:hypothetical protein